MTEASVEAVTAQLTARLFRVFFKRCGDAPAAERRQRARALIKAAPPGCQAEIQRYLHCCEVVWDGAKDPARRASKAPRPVVEAELVAPTDAQAGGQAAETAGAQASPSQAAIPTVCPRCGSTRLRKLLPTISAAGRPVWVLPCEDCIAQGRQAPA